jgi:hypothetical protein
MTTAYKDPTEAQAGLTSAFSPATDAQKTAIADAAALVPGASPAAPAVSPIQRTIDPGVDAATKYLDTFKAPETADQIAERLRQGSQGAIDAINKVYDDQVSANNVAGQERLAQDNAISVLSGLTGSTEAGRTRGAVLDKNAKETQAINNERLLKLQSLYTQISQQALDEAKAQREDATKSANDIVARRAQAQTQTLDTLKAIAAGGLVDFDSFKNSPQNADVYQHALDAVGGSEQALRGLFAVNRPQDQLVGTPTRVGDHFIQAYQNPLTGKVSYDTIEVPGGLPPQYSNFQKIGDNIVAIPDGWDGDISKLKTIYGGSGGGAPSGYNGEFAATIDLAANQGGTNAQRSQIKNTLQTLVANKDYPSAYALVAQSTASGLKGSAATTFQNQATSLSVLGDLQTAIKAYADAGGNTNIFKGAADDIQTKIGKLYTDPKYAALATQLDSAFQQYRLNMTGAAFGPKESAEYASVLPAKGNTLDLNLAKLNGAKAYLNSSVEGAIKQVVGQGGVEIKKYAEGATSAGAAPSSSDTDPLGLGI